jgi:opacity protein-like surface antigen
MFKKVLLASSVLALTCGVAMANSAPYIGASAGMEVNTVNRNVAVGTYRGVPFNLFAGYGALLSQTFYIAGELLGTVGTGDVSGTNTLKTSYSLAGSIIPGIMINNSTMLFGRAGVISSHFTNLNDSREGGQFGLGMQTGLTQSVDIRTEYDFVAYKSLTTTKIPGYASTTISPRADEFNLGLVYKFD